MRAANRSLVICIAALAPLAAACGRNGSEPRVGTLTVFAASSLTSAFTEVGAAFAEIEPDVEIVFNFAGSSALVTQVGEGAPADVVASADLESMSRLVESGDTLTTPVVFTTNRAQIVVAAGNPAGITELADLSDPRLIVVTCASDVPCGRYTRQVLDRAGVTLTPKSLEENVKAVVSKVALGEADAGIVYVTDVRAAGDTVSGVDLPADVGVVAEYPIAATGNARDPRTAQAFIDFVRSSAGQQILASHGFGAP